MPLVIFKKVEPVTFATWNPADKAAGVTLSNGDLTASATINSAVRSTIGKSSGKWYWEVTADGAGTFRAIGVGTSVATLNSPGGHAQSYGYAGWNGQLLNGGGGYDTGATFTTNDVIGIALDMDANTLQFYKNNVAQGALKGGLIASIFYAMFGSGFGTAVVTANFGATALTYTPPGGFNTGLYS